MVVCIWCLLEKVYNLQEYGLIPTVVGAFLSLGWDLEELPSYWVDGQLCADDGIVARNCTSGCLGGKGKAK